MAPNSRPSAAAVTPSTVAPDSHTWQDTLAWAVSYVLNPLILMSLVFFLPWSLARDGPSLVFAGTHLGALAALFSAYWAILRVRGKDLDLELNRRADRVLPLGMTIAGVAVVGLVMWRWKGIGSHVYTDVAAAVCFAVFWVITTRWKVSLHSLAVSLVLSALFFLLDVGPAYLPLLLLLPLVVWARLHLRFHDLGQTLVGILIGVSMVFLFMWLMSANPLNVTV